MTRAGLAEQLATQPLTTEPNLTQYEWAGTTLQRLFGARHPIAESWAFFSGPSKPATIAGAGGLTMEALVAQAPQVLGPAGADPEHHGQKYFFVKFLDPSGFPPFAYVGLRPEAVAEARRPLRPYLAELLWQDRQALGQLAELLRPHLTSEQAVRRFQAAYTSWAIAQAQRDWMGEAPQAISGCVPLAARAAVEASLAAQQRRRRTLTGLMHCIPFSQDEAILIETPTLHAIAGLSLQIHPNAPGNCHPKDELWIFRRVPLPGGAAGWILVEPQRTFDKTESGADFFTPFAWERDGLGFRKAITRASLDEFVSLMDATAHPQAHYLRRAQPMAVAGGTIRGQAQWVRLVEEPGWPYFLARELVFGGPGEATMPLSHRCFIELHATEGAVTVRLTGADASAHETVVTPTRPVFLPASLPCDMLTCRADTPARLQFFTR